MIRNILILEDNVQTGQVIENIIKEMHREVNVLCHSKVETAYRCSLEKSIDIFIIDIILNAKKPDDISGIIFAQKIRKMPQYYFNPIIFVTALADPELFSYKNIHCFGYIEKPFSRQQIIEVLHQAFFYKTPKEKNKIVYLRKDGILYAVKLDEIIWTQVQNHKMYVKTKTDILEIPYKTIKAFLEETDSDDLLQCNRYTVINKNYIKNIDLSNRYISLWGEKKRIDIGLTFKKRILEITYATG